MSKKSRAESAAALASVGGDATPPAANPRAKQLPPVTLTDDAIPAVTAALPALAPAEAAVPIAEQRGLVAPAAIHYRETLTIGQVFASPLNPRRHIDPAGLAPLALSIAQKGLLQPLLCRPVQWHSGTPDLDLAPFDGASRAELILGARRLLAIKMAIAGVADTDGRVWRLPADYKIPLRLRHPTSDRDLRILAATENFDREDMDPLDEAELFESLRADMTPETGITPEAEIARLFPKVSERTVFRRRALLRCTAPVQLALRAKTLTLAQAEAFAIGEPDRQNALLDEIADGALGVTPVDIREALAEDELIAVASSGIDPALYEGEIIEDEEDEGERYFVDGAQVRRLRREALDAKAAELRERWPWVEIVGDNLNRVVDFNRWGVADDDPEAGAIVYRQNQAPYTIEVLAPVLRKATVDARNAAAERAERRAASAAPAPARPPLSPLQAARLHAIKTQALRRAIANPQTANGAASAATIALALGILGLGGARELRYMGARGFYDIRSAPIASAQQEQDRLAHLVRTASLAMHPKDKPQRRQADNLGLSQDGHDSANVAAWFWALLEMDGADLAELYRRLLAERVGSWFAPLQEARPGGGTAAFLGDTPLAAAIATATGAEAYLPELWQPDLEWFKAYSRERLVGIVRDQLRIRNAEKMKKGELAQLCVEQPKGFWQPRHFPECAFQLEAEAAAALAGPLPAIPEPAEAAE